MLQTSHFGCFEHVWSLPSKTIMPTCRNFDVYLHAKNELHFLNSFLRYCKLVTLNTLRILAHAVNNDSIALRARSLVVSDLRSETEGSRFEYGCYYCIGELSAVIARLMSKCL